MNNDRAESINRFNWRLPVYAVFSAMIIFLPVSLYSSQWGSLLYLLGIVPAISLVLLITGIVLAVRREPRRALAIVAALGAFWIGSWILWRNELAMRSEIRWLFRSKAYKAQVLAQPLPANGKLRHVEWDGWGFVGAGDTIVYLVFDPNDNLAKERSDHSPGKFHDIPCEVPDIQRLEPNWYTVLFYTDTSWDHCN